MNSLNSHMKEDYHYSYPGLFPFVKDSAPKRDDSLKKVISKVPVYHLIAGKPDITARQVVRLYGKDN